MLILTNSDIVWSPDSKKIMWNDKLFRLQYVDIATQEVTVIDRSNAWEITEFNWSPDSKWITYSRPERETLFKIILYNTVSKEKTEITDGWYESKNPVFSNDGNYLLFTSARTFNPIFSETEWNHAYQNMNKIYLVTLSKSTKSPFAPTDNTVKVKAAEVEADKSAGDKKAETAKPVEVKVDPDGIQDRIVELPVSGSNYAGIVCIGKKLYYHEMDANVQKPSIKMYDLEKKEEKAWEPEWCLSHHLTARKCWYGKITPMLSLICRSAPIDFKETVDLSNMKVWVNLPAEWKQIFYESWRQMRDFFYAPNMHGTDWTGIRDKYAALLPYVKHRDDLTYVIGEMIAELSIGHTYVLSGDKPKAERISTGLAGRKIRPAVFRLFPGR